MLINGKGIPTIGIIPITIARLIKIVETKIKLKPPIVNLQNLSLAFKAKYKHLKIIKKNTKRRIHTPMKPNSSATVSYTHLTLPTTMLV